jgi:hypothetical protein
MKTIAPIVISIFLLTISCEEEIQNPDLTEPGPEFILQAGDAISDSVIYHEFDPYITVRGSRTGVDTNFYYLDSVQLDLNEDGNYDLLFEYYMYYIEYYCDRSGANDSVAVDCFPDADAFCRIKTNESVEIALEQTYFGLMPKKFDVGDSIDSRHNWSELPNKTRFSYPTSLVNWDTDEYTKYMGFRVIEKNDTIYGWIRLNTYYSSRIEIFDFAIEN